MAAGPPVPPRWRSTCAISSPDRVDPREAARQWKRAAAVLLGGILLVALVLALRPLAVDGSGDLRECLDGTPFVFFDDGSSFYNESRSYLTIATWPNGFAYDPDRDAVFDASGGEVLRLGGRLAVKGIVIDTPGDPAPCYNTVGLKIESLRPLP